jgi:hypothetical protein
VGSTLGLLVALAVASPAQPINLNLPPLAIPPTSPAPPPWSNFQLQVPTPPSRPAWLPSSFLPDLKRAASNTRGNGYGHGVNPFLGGDRSHGGDRGSDPGGRR